MPHLSVSVLGPLVAAHDGQPVEAFGYNKVRGLLAYLAVEAGRPHPRAQLCALLWPDQPDRAARRNLSQALTHLRRALAGAGPLLRATAHDVQLDSTSVTVDSTQFLEILDTAERHAHRSWHTCTSCAEHQQAALALYRGDFLADLSLPDSVPFDEWALVWRERLRQRALTTLERLARWAEWRGDFTRAAAFARRQVDLDPLSETTHREAIRLLALNGEQAAAAAQYDQLQRMLAVEFGLEPDPESVALRQRLRAEDPNILRRLQAPPFDGPAAPNALVGRASALAAIRDYLRAAGARALTLIGPPGIGKTRLAYQAAAELRYDYEDGVHLVELAPLAQAGDVPEAVAQALAVQDQAGQQPPARLVAHLKRKHLLLVLDNFEHLLEAAGFVAELLAACPALQVLATSRAPLRIHAERTLSVAPLEPAAAAQLFLERAGPIAAPPPPEVVAAICQRLDQLPLAIELIAVRARALTPGELLRQLEQPLGALTTAPRDAPERHQTLSAAIAWSYDRLAPEQQAVFRHLGVFVGGATLEGAQAVADPDGPILPILATLHEASLLHRQAAGGETRFSLLETLRQFALEQLAARGAAEVARRRHAEYFLALAEQAHPHLDTSGQTQWLERLEREHANLRAALAWHGAHAPHGGLRLAIALAPFWEVRGYLTEGRRWLQDMLERCAAAPPAERAAALGAVGLLAFRQSDYAGARELQNASLALWHQLEDRPAMSRTLRRLGAVAYSLGELAQAQTCHEQSLALAREIDDPPNIAGALNSLGLLAVDRGEYPRARTMFSEALPIFRKLDDRLGAGLVLNNLGLLAWYERDDAAARAWLEQSIEAFEAIGLKWGLALAWLNLGNVAHSQTDLAGAQDHFQRSLALYRELGDQASASYPLFGLGEVAFGHGDYAAARSDYRESLRLRQAMGETRPLPRNLEALAQLERLAGRPELAARLFGAAQSLRASQGLRVMPPYQPEYEAEVAALRAALGAATFEAAWAAGSTLNPEQAVALALRGM